MQTYDNLVAKPLTKNKAIVDDLVDQVLAGLLFLKVK